MGQMVQVCKGVLAIEVQWLVANGVISDGNYRSLIGRRDVRVVRRGCRGVNALVDYESLPERFKRKIVDMIGDPYQRLKVNMLEGRLQSNTEAATYYEEYITASGRHLPVTVVRQYHAEACIMDAISGYLAAKSGKRRALGHRAAKVWDEVVDCVKDLDTQVWPHKLPANARSLQRKYQQYCKDGYESLVHNNYKARLSNSDKMRTEEERALLFNLVSDPRNLNDAQVVQLYNINRPSDASPVTARMVGYFRQEHEQEIYARRHGATQFRANRLMTVKRSAPSAPLYLWTLDGWDAELLYQKTVVDKKGHAVTTYHNRLTIEVVLDACTKYPIGYAIADNESPTLIREALRNALNHVQELFGGRFRPAQIQMDHAGYKSLEELYKQTAIHVTPAQVRNAKAKVVEPWFRYFNDTYCHLQTNWNGYGVTSRKENQPNADFINKYRKDFPDREGCIAQLEKFIAMERARLHDEYVAKWSAMPEENRFPMTTEAYLMAYGERTERTYLMRNTGITMTLPGTGGRKLEFDCFDHNFRRYASTQWTMVYDPADTAVVMAVNADGTLRFMLEEKHVQPMALIERREGDAEALQRVRNFNREEEARISDLYAAIDSRKQRLLEMDEEQMQYVAARDYNTLSKLCIVDSDGQHKSQKAAARIEMQQTDVGDLY